MWYFKSESYTRNEAEAFQLHTSNVGWLVHSRWPNKTRRAFCSSDPLGSQTYHFDRDLKAGNSALLAAKMVIKNPEEVNVPIVSGKQSKEYFHRVTGHAGHHLMDATAKYYKVNLTGKVNNCLSCSLEKIRQKNIPKKNEDKSENPGERMYLDISSMRKPSMGGRQHWVMLVDEATKYDMSQHVIDMSHEIYYHTGGPNY